MGSKRWSGIVQAFVVAAPLALAIAPAAAEAKDKVGGRVCDGDASPTVDPSGKVTWSCRSGGVIVSGDTVEQTEPGGTGSGGGREPRVPPRRGGKGPIRGGETVPDPVPRQRPDPAGK